MAPPLNTPLLPADKPTSANLAVSYHSYTVNVNWFAFKILEHQNFAFYLLFFFFNYSKIYDYED